MAGGGVRKRKDGVEKEPSTPPSSSTSKKNKKGQDGGPFGMPLWLWIVGGFALLVVFGSVFVGDGDSSGKKAAGGKKSAGGGKTGKSDTFAMLSIGLRLQEMTDIAGKLLSTGEKLDPEAGKILDDELNIIEAQLNEEPEGDTVARDLKAMVSVVRGTLYQKSDKLTDEQVEKMNNAFTYANPRYWDDYYNKTGEGELYDWYGTWDSPIDEMTFQPEGSEKLTATKLGDVLRPFLDTKKKILMFGCGNSDMSEKMYLDGFQDITNIDISEKLLENLRQRLQAKMPKMKWIWQDASALKFEDGAFDITIDKGTLDAIEGNDTLRDASVLEARRTLRPGGLFLSVTFNNEAKRVERQLRKVADWGTCETIQFNRPKVKGQKQDDEKLYFVHACRRPQ